MPPRKAGVRLLSETDKRLAYVDAMGHTKRNGEPRTFRGLAIGMGHVADSRVTEQDVIRLLHVHRPELFHVIRMRQRRVLVRWAREERAKRRAAANTTTRKPTDELREDR